MKEGMKVDTGRSQFTFYDSFYRALSRIRKKADKADAYDAIVAYALLGEEPDLEKLSDAAAIAFEVIRPNLDASRRKAASGKQGGKSKKQTGSKPEANASNEEANHKQEKEQVKEQEQDKDKDKEQMLYKASPSAKKAKTVFAPPSVDEVRAYCLERQNGIDPQAFVDFYASKNWMVGKSKMSDWKASVRTWEQRRKQEAAAVQPRPPVSYRQQTKADELDEFYAMAARFAEGG